MSDHEQALTADEGTDETGHEEHGNRFYLVTWLWLVVITAAEVGLTMVEPPRGLLVTGLLTLTVLKAGLIIANFMHVRFERLNFLMVVLTPFVVALVMYFGFWYDFINIPR